MAYGFVKQSGGHIRIESAPGKGTTLKVYLPRSTQPEAGMPSPPDESVVGGNETILVVEDDLEVQATVVGMLQEFSYRVLKASNAKAALDIVTSGMPIDLLFTDVVMPGTLSSPQLAAEAKRLQPALSVLFTSGYTRNALESGGRLAEGVQLLSKPYRREQLAHKVRQALAQNKRAQAIADESDDALREQSSASGRNILVVEDMDDLREFACEMLSLLGYKVQGAASAEDGLSLLAAERFDVLFTDIGLPGMDGVTFAEKASGENGIRKVILVTGNPDAATHMQGTKPYVLKKPYSISELQQALDTV